MSTVELPKMPDVKFTKSGYELRTEILNMAQSFTVGEFHAKYQGWECSVARDEKTGQIVTKVDMPTYPGLDKVLETAQKMYDFVSAGSVNRK